MGSERGAAHHCIHGKRARFEYRSGQTLPPPGYMYTYDCVTCVNMYTYRLEPNGLRGHRWAVHQRAISRMLPAFLAFYSAALFCLSAVMHLDGMYEIVMETVSKTKYLAFGSEEDGDRPENEVLPWCRLHHVGCTTGR